MTDSLALDLTPARWIWFPSGRTLPNTFVLFRRVIEVGEGPLRCSGWLSADSRYRLTVNGRRVQWGPAPCDPRWQEADPVDLSGYLEPGPNVIGVEVLHYGLGDGTWPGGKPGLLCRLDLEQGGQRQAVVSDSSWLSYLDRAHRPGQHRRWFLRALQEEFDARLHPFGWDTPGYRPHDRWLPAAQLEGAADKPSSCTSHPAPGYPDYFGREPVPPGSAELRRRAIPLMTETTVAVRRLAESGSVRWSRDPADWFDLRTPGCFEVERRPVAQAQQDGSWLVPPSGSSDAAILTFEMTEQVVGWPYFTVEASEGTVVELMCQESHELGGPAWLDTSFFAWSRFVCREGLNDFETFDFESLRWLQLHVRGARGPVTISKVGVRRRVFPFPKEAHLSCSDPGIERLVTASINTLRNSAQETCVDGMGRERAQYSGDGGHQLHAIRLALGERRLPERYLRTFSQGISVDGWFLDCWPANGRLEQLGLRQVGASSWGALLDHGVGFGFDCWHHYLETGDLGPMEETYPRLLRLVTTLAALGGEDGLLPVEGLGSAAVWMDHDAYLAQHHKQCAFNLYAAAMLNDALAPLARAMGAPERAEELAGLGSALIDATIKHYWCERRRLFICNLPWEVTEGGPRMCDRSLATAVLFEQCPGGEAGPAAEALASCPPEMGLSYPANAGWRYHALARSGRIDVVLHEMRTRWATMRSVAENNTLQELWEVAPDTTDEWSHCPMAPLNVLLLDVAGIRPASPGFARVTVRPQLGDLDRLELTMHTVRGDIGFRAQSSQGNGRPGGPISHHLGVSLPAGCQGDLLVPASVAANPLQLLGTESGLARYRLEPGRMNEVSLGPADMTT